MDKRQRIRLFERSDGACEDCGGPAQEAHHVIFKSHYGKKRRKEQEDDSNYATLCRVCHGKRHGLVVKA